MNANIKQEKKNRFIELSLPLGSVFAPNASVFAFDAPFQRPSAQTATSLLGFTAIELYNDDKIKQDKQIRVERVK